jgi:hypothetical protein
VAAFVGWHPRGPLTPTVVNSWTEFAANYGGFENAYPPSDLAMGVYTYFAGGGSSAVIVRSYNTSGAGPTTGTLTLLDQSTAPGVSTLRVDAANPGAWGNNLYVDIQSTANSPVFTLQVYYMPLASGTPGPSNLVERWENLTMTPGATISGANSYAPDVLNSTFSGSHYIKLTALADTNPPPSNNPTPVVGYQLVGGGDGALPSDPDTNTAIHLLDQFPDQPFVLNLPNGYHQNDVGNAIAYAQTRNDVFVVLDCPPSYDPPTMANWPNSSGASATPLAAVYYPRVRISDPYSQQLGTTRLIPPGGYVVGQYISTDANRGVQKAPAGLGASLPGVSGLETVLKNSDLGLLTQANVNCIIAVPGSGIVIWGARTLSSYLFTRYVPVSRTLIYLQSQFVAMTKFAVFEPNDYILWGQLTAVLYQFLTSFWQSGGLQGNSAAQAFYILCDQTNNTPSTIQNGIVNIEIGVALQRPAEFVVIRLGQWAGGQSVQIANI